MTVKQETDNRSIDYPIINSCHTTPPATRV